MIEFIQINKLRNCKELLEMLYMDLKLFQILETKQKKV